MDRHPSPIFIFLLGLFLSSTLSDASSIGVNYGRIADNLPSAVKVVQLLKSQGINKIRVYDTDPSVLKALSGSGIKVTVNLPNQLLFHAAKRLSFAYSWVQTNIVAYHPSTQIESIAVGNEVFVDTHNTTLYLVPAMKNIQAALAKYNLASQVKISTPIALSALANSYPPSAGCFRPEFIEPAVKPLLQFLRETDSFLMVNAYPFFAYEWNSNVISLDYALFRENPGIVDAGNGLRYFSLFDAQIDAVFAAMSALKYEDISIVVSETGWPSKGDSNEIGASLENAAAYNGNLVRRVLTGKGTPLRPKTNPSVYLFALFNENKKLGPTSERNYGLFYPNEQKVYDIPSFKPKSSPEPTRGGTIPATSSSEHSWCVANGSVGKVGLLSGLDYACGEGGADCHPIQPGCPCYQPNTLEAHASYAFNSYYQKKGRSPGTCFFGGAAFITHQKPSFGKCEFPTGY